MNASERLKHLECAVLEYLDGGPASRMVESAKGLKGPLAEAARAMARGGKGHAGPCIRDTPDGACSVHIRTARARARELARLVGR